MKKTKIAGLGVIVLVVVALAGCDLFGDSRGPGFGYVPLRPPVEESVKGTGLQLPPLESSLRSSVSVSSQTPAQAAREEYGRLRGALDGVDRQMRGLDDRASGDGIPECINAEPITLTLNIPDMGDRTESLTAQIQCKETHSDSPSGEPILDENGEETGSVYHNSQFFGLEENVFYLIEIQEMDDIRPDGPVRSHSLSYARHNRITDEVLFWSFTFEKEGGAPSPELSRNWATLVAKIDAKPEATSGNQFRLDAVRDLAWVGNLGDNADPKKGFLIPERLQVIVTAGGDAETIDYLSQSGLVENNPENDQKKRLVGETEDDDNFAEPQFTFGDHVDEAGKVRPNSDTSGSVAADESGRDTLITLFKLVRDEWVVRSDIGSFTPPTAPSN